MQKNEWTEQQWVDWGKEISNQKCKNFGRRLCQFALMTYMRVWNLWH